MCRSAPVRSASERSFWRVVLRSLKGRRARRVDVASSAQSDLGFPAVADSAMASGYRWLSSPAQVDAGLRSRLASCWLEVSNAGGAVGFPFLPVPLEEVTEATERLCQSLDADGIQLLVALDGEDLMGWLALEKNRWRLTSHWGRIFRVQTALAYRGLGIGRALMAEAARSARDDFGLEQLHLELRSGQGLEEFYKSCGWREVGRWPAALRLDVGDDRDEVLMLLDL